jgi:hypothetical protein
MMKTAISAASIIIAPAAVMLDAERKWHSK